MPKLIEREILNVLAACKVDGCKVFLPTDARMLGYEKELLPRDVYVATDKVLKALGGKWTGGKVRAHVFPTDPTEQFDQVVLTGEYTTARDSGWFPTPPPVVMEVLRHAGIERGHRVLEPSGGTGAIVDRVLRSTHADTHVITVELDEFRSKELEQLAGAHPSRVIVVPRTDFLRWPSQPLGLPSPFAFDRVVMNPPFVKRTETDHVLHAYDLLKPGGRLVSVLPTGVMFREDKKADEFRAIVEQCGELVKLPEGSFTVSGTNVNTCLAVMNK